MEEYVDIRSHSDITFNAQSKVKALEIVEKATNAILSRNFHRLAGNCISLNFLLVHDGGRRDGFDQFMVFIGEMKAGSTSKLIVDALLQRFLPLAKRRIETVQAQATELITYMRTDGLNISDEVAKDGQSFIMYTSLLLLEIPFLLIPLPD
ncbi:unnamed protein product [Fraxinus pennsylvanica]|uniref:Uncharacterized protein n=1 Tax=Fraxinus pennsylvanica TaxID=56036 RepID=A0AAD2DUL9_9LAMI|nr:unnamed protein product [Fraxinus pennsylvanica]